MDDLIEDIYPLSHMQSGILFQSMLSPEKKLYFEQAIFKINQPFDSETLVLAIRKLVQSQKILRTVFDWDGDAPIQIVLKRVNFDVLSITSHESLKEFLSKELDDDLKNNFDLEKGPLIRFKLLRNRNSNFLFLSYHHILFDGASLQILLNELSFIYKHVKSNSNYQYVPKTQFKDFIRWLYSQNNSLSLDYWRKYLEGFESMQMIQENQSSNNSESVEYVIENLDSEIVNDLTVIAKNSRVTTNNILQTAWGITLSLINGHSELIFGSTVSGRPYDLDQSDEMLGIFINTLPVRIHIAENKSFIDHIHQVQNDWIEMHEHAWISLSEISKMLKSPIKSDPFDTIFVYQKVQKSEMKEFLSFELVKYRELTNYSLTLDVMDRGNEIDIQISFSPNQFSKDKVTLILKTYIQTLEALLEKPNVALGSMLTFSTLVKQVEKSVETNNHRDVLPEVIDDLKVTWQEVLGIERIDENDNFFEIGGDSITCLRIVSKLHKRGYDVTLKKVFENPSVKELAGVIGKRNKNENLTIRKNNFSALNHRDFAFDRITPMSYLQQSVFNDIEKGNTRIYHDQSVFTYKGVIDVDIYKDAWQHVVDQNEILRTIFTKKDGQFLQCVLKKWNVDFQFVDLSLKETDEKLIIIENYHKTEVEQLFEFSLSPPLRIRLLKTDCDLYILLLSFSVLIIDGWCFAFVLNDVDSFYHERINKQSKNLITKRSQYRDYVDWLSSKDYQEGLKFWKKCFNNFSPSLDVPHRISKFSFETQEIGEVTILLNKEDRILFEKIAQDNQVTLNSIMQTAWAYSLSEISKKNDVIIGITTSGRPATLDGSDEMIGLFFNDLPVRYKFDKSCSFMERVKTSQLDFASIREYEYIPTLDIKDLVELGSDDVLFQSLFIYENYPIEEENKLKSKKDRYYYEISNSRRELTNIDINVYVEVRDEVRVQIKYIKSLFHKGTIEQLLNSYVDFLKSLLQ